MATAQSGQIRTTSFSIATGTTTTPVAAVAGASIVVVHAVFSLTGTVSFSAKFQDGAAIALSGTFDTTGIFPLTGRRTAPIMSTSNGQSLQIVTTTGGTVSMQGVINYYLDTSG